MLKKLRVIFWYLWSVELSTQLLNKADITRNRQLSTGLLDRKVASNRTVNCANCYLSNQVTKLIGANIKVQRGLSLDTHCSLSHVILKACSHSGSYIKHVPDSTVYKNSSLHMCHAYSMPRLYIRLDASQSDVVIMSTWSCASNGPELGNQAPPRLAVRRYGSFYWLAVICLRCDWMVWTEVIYIYRPGLLMNWR